MIVNININDAQNFLITFFAICRSVLTLRSINWSLENYILGILRIATRDYTREKAFR